MLKVEGKNELTNPRPPITGTANHSTITVKTQNIAAAMFKYMYLP